MTQFCNFSVLVQICIHICTRTGNQQCCIRCDYFWLCTQGHVLLFAHAQFHYRNTAEVTITIADSRIISRYWNNRYYHLALVIALSSELQHVPWYNISLENCNNCYTNLLHMKGIFVKEQSVKSTYL